jgi:hypothetical protein
LDVTNLPLISGDLYERADTVAQLQFGARASNFVSSQGLSRIVLLYALATISTVMLSKLGAPDHDNKAAPATRLAIPIAIGRCS